MPKISQEAKDAQASLGITSVERSIYSIIGGNILIFGDLHLSSTYEGRHKSYVSDCFYAMKHIKDLVIEQKPSMVVFLGDIVGVQERTLRDRPFLVEVLMFFRELNKITNNNVYAVKGNHDIADYSDFDSLVALGLIKNPRYVDFFGEDENDLEVRFHFVNYGEEERELIIPEEGGFSNVVLCHNDIQVSGVTNWYTPTKGAKELSTLKNWSNVDLVISGHIHHPSREIVFTSINNVNSIGLFYPGCPTRVANTEKYNSCYAFTFKFAGRKDGTTYDVLTIKLKPYEESFILDDTVVNDKDEKTLEEVKEESLKNIIKEIMDGRIISYDMFDQIKGLPGLTDTVKELACGYLKKAIDEKNASK